MSFASPLWLVGLAALPLLLALYAAAERRRRREATRFARPAMLPNVVDREPRRLRHLPAVLFLAALAAMLVGLGRPHAALSVPREESTVVLAIDTSRSMVATDVQPSRLEAARRAAKAFLAQVPEKYRIGIVSFSTTAAVAAPPTADREVVRAALDALRPQSGTAIGDAISRALEVGRAAGASPSDRRAQLPASILLLSDGAQTQGRLRPLQAAQRARSLGVKVHTIVLGTSNAVVEVPRPGGFVERVTVPPDPQTLQAVAAATGGTFSRAPNAARLKAVYEELASRVGHKREKREITFAFAAGALAFLLAGGIASAVLFRRLP